jgi:FixJ family two-component response regulator
MTETYPEDLASGQKFGSRRARLDAEAMKPTTPIVYVVDDDVSVGEALELLLATTGWRTQTFDSAQAFLSRPRDACPGCLVLDICLPDLSGLELQRHLAADQLAIPVIFVTGHGDVPTTVRAMKAGAVEFLVKPFDDESLLDAVRRAIARSVDMLNYEDSMRTLRERYASLSRREREVMTFVTSGLLNKQVGGELGISEITVKAHRGNVMRKMGASSLAALVTMAATLRSSRAPKTPWPDSDRPVGTLVGSYTREATQ